ncbi:MAG: 3-deoxy-D-manno-octulosonic acid transferase [Kiritimatiellae bacterium]|nr:3-deoxy-D-manno-octulosonic acid transferase [Kiritimatiellia bacterium]
MTWLLYNVLFILGFILLLPRFLYRMIRRGGYGRNFLERFGCYRPEVRARLAEGGRVWIQAVSVGEIFVAFQFVDRLRAQRPGLRFVLSTTTSTGHAIAEKKIGPEDVLVYFPLDTPLVTRRVLGLIRPAALVLVECELWPNLIRLAKRRGVPVALINGRISEHSYRGYRRLRFFTSRLLPLADLFCVQSRKDEERLAALGAPRDRLKVMGSAKYEVAQPDPAGEARAREVLARVGFADGRLVLLGGSTWAGEEGALLDTYQALRAEFPDLALVLVPRHAERAGEVVREIEGRGLTLVRRSRLEDARGARPDVLLIDTTGELKDLYACATVIFVGKSLTQHGGQNVIEPALHAKPIIVGPNMQNFPVVSEDFLLADALVQVGDAAGLTAAVREFLADPARRAAYGERAARLVREKAGAVEATVDLIVPLIRA